MTRRRECVCVLAGALDTSACACCAGDRAVVGIMLVRLCVLVVRACNRVIYKTASVFVPQNWVYKLVTVSNTIGAMMTTTQR